MNIVGQSNYTAADNNFKLNLWLESVRVEYLSSHDIDWNAISPELKDEINKLTTQLKKCLDLSTAECKRYARS